MNVLTLDKTSEAIGVPHELCLELKTNFVFAAKGLNAEYQKKIIRTRAEFQVSAKLPRQTQVDHFAPV